MGHEELTGRVQTVLGIIDAASLGVTLAHEHVLISSSRRRVEPTEAGERGLLHQPLTLENLSWMRLHGRLGFSLLDEQLAIKETLLYKRAGGDSIIELTSIGIGRDPLGLARIARATGLNIIMGAGYYVGATHPPELTAKTEEEVTEEIIREIMVGIGDTGVRAGIIGEVGSSAPLMDNERKVLRASAAAQQRTGAAINVHPPYSADLVLEVIKILSDAGADLSRTVISHVDLGYISPATCRKIADAGCYIEFDMFGQSEICGTVPYPSPPGGSLLGMRSEVDRINEVKRLIDEGYLNQMLLSSDIDRKINYVTYGGAGYAHILRETVPWMRLGGISDEQIHTMMVENPKRVLSFAPVKE